MSFCSHCGIAGSDFRSVADVYSGKPKSYTGADGDCYWCSDCFPQAFKIYASFKNLEEWKMGRSRVGGEFGALRPDEFGMVNPSVLRRCLRRRKAMQEFIVFKGTTSSSGHDHYIEMLRRGRRVGLNRMKQPKVDWNLYVEFN